MCNSLSDKLHFIHHCFSCKKQIEKKNKTKFSKVRVILNCNSLIFCYAYTESVILSLSRVLQKRIFFDLPIPLPIRI